MGDTDSSNSPPAEYSDHLSRSERVWDRWSDRYGRSESDFEPIRTAAIERLKLEPGDRVLDVGCGPGVNLAELRAGVGQDGDVVAVDYSPKMVERARERVADHGWDNVEVRRADATTADLGRAYDAAVATLSMSVMPDVERALRNVHDSLAPGARFAVVDLRPFPSGPQRILNPLLRWFFRWYANWNPEGDVLAGMDTVFGDCRVVDTHLAGVAYTALARRSDPD